MRTCTGRCDISLSEVTHHNVMQLKRVNQVVFPVSYNDKFYRDVVGLGELVKLAYFNDIVVGGVCCRIDVSNDKRRMYIMTLGCLAPYRRFGLGTLMLDHVFKMCEKDPSIESILLHVQTSNESALNFYEKFGFKIVEIVENYYKRIEPADAYVLEKKLNETMEAVHSLDQDWHKQCLTCAAEDHKGGRSLSVGGMYYNVEDGKPYCKKCYRELFGQPPKNQV